MSHDTVTGPVLDATEESAQTEVAPVKATLSPLTPAQRKLLASLNEETASAMVKDEDRERELDKIVGLFGALESVKDAAMTNQTYVGAYAVRKFVGTDESPRGMTRGELALKLGVTASRVTQYGRAAELAFDLGIDPMSDVWRVTSSAQNSPEFSKIREEGLTVEAVENFWNEEKQIASLKGKDKTEARAARRERILGKKEITTGASNAAPNGDGATLSPNGKRAENILGELDTFTVPDADDCASLLAMRDRIAELLALASESDRKAGQATQAKLSKRAGK